MRSCLLSRSSGELVSDLRLANLSFALFIHIDDALYFST